MTVPPRSANDPAPSANPGLVDLRRGGHALGGSHLFEGRRLVTGWHSHDLHQIEYAVTGIVEVETASARHLLPTHQAAWIPAGVEHQAVLDERARTVAVLFHPNLVPGAGDRVRILAMPSLLREMMIYAVRWPITRIDDDPAADDFFRTLGHLVADALDHEAPLALPTPTDPVVSAAVAFTHDHLDSVNLAEVCRAAGASERTLRRRFESDLGLSWRDYLIQARLLRAMTLLAEPGPTVLDVSTAVGFDNVSAFARSFAQRCGETPTAYRRRVNS